MLKKANDYEIRFRLIEANDTFCSRLLNEYKRN